MTTKIDAGFVSEQYVQSMADRIAELEKLCGWYAERVRVLEGGGQLRAEFIEVLKHIEDYCDYAQGEPALDAVELRRMFHDVGTIVKSWGR